MPITFTLDKKCQEILKIILYTNGYIKVQDIANQMDMSKRSVYYDINKINEWLRFNQIDELKQTRSKGIQADVTQTQRIQALLFEQESNEVQTFSPEDRYKMEICSIIICSESLFVEDFESLCDVSRNTIISDLKHDAELLKKYDLELIYSIKDGYQIIGDVIKRRAVFFLYFPGFYEYYFKHVFNKQQNKKIAGILDTLHTIEAELETEYVKGILPTLATFIMIIKTHVDSIDFNDMDTEEILDTSEYALVAKYFPYIRSDEKIYIALHLLGSRLQTVPVNVMKEPSRSFKVAKQLVSQFTRTSGIQFEHEDELINAINAHLKTSMYRYRYGIQLGNPMLNSIKMEYSELFELTKKAALQIEDEIGMAISDSEIAYLTLHFGAFMRPKDTVDRAYRILIVCPNGIGTGNMIRSEVTSLVPQATEIVNLPLSRYRTDHRFDVVISTVPLKDEENLILVHPILTDQDRVAILRKCMYTEPQVRMQMEDILEIASKYIPLDQLENFQNDLQAYYSNIQIHQAPQKNYGYGLEYYLNENHIQIFTEQTDWESALRYSCQPLLQSHSITNDYVEAIVNDQKNKQLYMFLADGLILAHTASENGVNKMDIAITTFKQPVMFLNKKEAHIIITLGAEDQTKHVRILNDLLDLFSKKKRIYQICATDNVSDIYQYIHEQLTNKKE